MDNAANIANAAGKPNIFLFLRGYAKSLTLLTLFTVSSSGLGLALPKIISRSIDDYLRGQYSPGTSILWFGGVSLLIFLATFAQGIVQTYVSEQAARDLRRGLAEKISRQSYAFVEKVTASKLLTNLTSDADAIKTFVSMAISSIVSSVIIIIGASILLVMTDWKLAIAVLAIVPLLGGLFYFLFGRARSLFAERQGVVDWLNQVINESILGAAIIRVLDSGKVEGEKFSEANKGAKDIGVRILSVFASLIPLITFISSLAILIILLLGGHFVIGNAMSIGDFAAFNSYVVLLIFPIIMLGFISNIISQATASYERISEVLDAEEARPSGDSDAEIFGNIELKGVTLKYGEKPVLKDISLVIPAGKKTAIIGPTAAGKTQLLHLLIGLVAPDEGSVRYDGRNIQDYLPEALHRQVGFVFQDSVIFNMSLRENIAFSQAIRPESLARALKAAELESYVAELPDGLETIVSERGSSLSGGQKQRIMLARALALDPRVLLLDDFTARVDNKTEKEILANIDSMYPGITLVSVTQKIATAESYDRIILLMEGEVVAAGTHEELLGSCPEYVQIYDSQRSTNEYE